MDSDPSSNCRYRHGSNAIVFALVSCVTTPVSVDVGRAYSEVFSKEL